ncbi:MAG: hypothetical protein HFF50_01045 [Lawsonibacter sp.]|nr:hypothetical protein [Lawsonibacter sp.]
MELFGYTVEVDDAATQDWYAQSEGWDCPCGHCRNFLQLARERKLPAFLLEALDRLGIPPEKATYVCEFHEKDGLLLYQASWRAAGRILREPAQEVFSSEQDCGTCGHEVYPHGAPGFPEPHFDLMFFLRLPWVLDEPIDGPLPKNTDIE